MNIFMHLTADSTECRATFKTVGHSHAARIAFKILDQVLVPVIHTVAQKHKINPLCTGVREQCLQKALYAACRHEKTMRNGSGSGVSMLEKSLNET